MAKKKRRTAGPAAAGTGSAAAGEPAAGAALGEELLASAVRAAQWLAGKGAAPGDGGSTREGGEKVQAPLSISPPPPDFW